MDFGYVIAILVFDFSYVTIIVKCRRGLLEITDVVQYIGRNSPKIAMVKVVGFVTKELVVVLVVGVLL